MTHYFKVFLLFQFFYLIMPLVAQNSLIPWIWYTVLMYELKIHTNIFPLFLLLACGFAEINQTKGSSQFLPYVAAEEQQ